MTTTTSGRFVANEGGPTPQNVEATVVQILVNEARAMMHEMFNQQQRELRELLDHKLDNIKGRVPVVNESVIVEQVSNEPIPLHATTVQEGNNDDSESY